MLLAHWQNVLSRPSWETVWAFLDGYYSYGAVAPLEQRFDPATALWQNHTGGAYTLWTTLGFGLLGLYLWTRKIDWRDARRTVAFVGLTWTLFALWSKGYSPQWALNFVPFIVLLLPNLRGGVYLGLVAAALLSEWPVAFLMLASQPAFLVAITLWRTALFTLLALEFGAIALSGSPTRRWSGVFWAAIGLLIVCGAVIGQDGINRYFQQQLAREPLRATIQRLHREPPAQTGVICRDISVCERIAPYLPGFGYFWLPAAAGWQKEYLGAFAARHPILWVVDNNQDLAIETFLSQHYGKESQSWDETGQRLTRFVAVEPADEQSTQADFGCCIKLVSYSLGTQGRYIHLKLNWQTTEPLDVSYKVFVHVYNPAGELVAQNDQYPGGDFSPTSQWPIGQSVPDSHGLILPEPVRPGYQIRIGWYDPGSGQRLPLAGSIEDAYEIAIP
jgi:hypothetical protein